MQKFTSLVVAVFCLAALLLAGSFLSAGATAQSSDQRRGFYLTTPTRTGGQALTACAPGFHMASLWEILDPSNLRYDTTLGFTIDDAGSGPPTAFHGWIRTGTKASGFRPAPRANCHAWESSSAVDYGTIVRLSVAWSFDAVTASPWSPGHESCSVAQRVWCVQD